MHVLFTSKLSGEITSFQPYSFREIVEKTDKLDEKWKQKNAEPVSLDFMIFNEEGDKLYNGTYVVGSEETTNIYNHICQKLLNLPLKDRHQETEKDTFLQKLTSYAPPSYRVDMKEQLEQHKTKAKGWKKLKKKEKVIVSSLAGLLVIAVIASITLTMVLSSQAQAMTKMEQDLTNAKAVKRIYETALNGDTEKAANRMKEQEYLSESEQKILIHLLIANKNYEEALQKVGKDDVSLIAGQVLQIHGLEELEKFQKSHPSPLGAFKVAYHSESYKKATAVEHVPMSTEIYKEKGLAYLQIDQIEEAKKMASEAKSDQLNQKINQYEQLKGQLNKLQEQIEKEKRSEGKNQNKIESLNEKKDKVENQLNNI
ncbi:hypothetical protein [Halobacillus amylolyticus]|uniref:Type VII secretion protein EssB n=1 Tax=Halobacillus amylolyticus TaxID=2932259 RepID=A0ABY4H6G2_9BACI|nr:hypothetical protein [Halobacillus amylolyticus]UOR10277.1 hypothetical protein MUO15_11160 [Halobacillus amylolyticus]